MLIDGLPPPPPVDERPEAMAELVWADDRDRVLWLTLRQLVVHLEAQILEPERLLRGPGAPAVPVEDLDFASDLTCDVIRELRERVAKLAAAAGGG